MKVKVYNQQAKEVGTATLPSDIFDVEMNLDLVHQAIVTQEANARVVLANTKGRGEVSGGGKKPWRQKGTGRARHASIRSPLWKGGGKAHGPNKEKIYGKKINKKARQAALRMALSSKVRDKEMFVVDSLHFDTTKTKGIHEMLKHFSDTVKEIKHPTFLLISDTNNAPFIHAVQNISFARTIAAKSLNVRDVLRSKFVLLPKEAIKVISETFGKKQSSLHKQTEDATPVKSE
jgi:large subunit ribosomal protein L4